MPRAKLPKLKIGSKKIVTKKLPELSKGKFWFKVAAAVCGLGVVGLIGLLLWTVAKDDKKSGSGSASASSPVRVQAGNEIATIDREKDREEPKAVPVEVDVENTIVLENQDDKPPTPAPHTDTSEEGLSFHVSNKSDMDKQFSLSGVNSSQKQKILASQLGRESILPSFSVERQPARQIGMSYDMVYQALRGDDKIERQFGEQVPFGGSEFQEMQRQMRT